MVDGRVPPPPPAAVELFGDRLPLIRAYAERLAGDGVERGLIGPREAPRLWDRHLVNCGVLAELLPPGAEVADVGTGAGLPGLVVALSRPDLHVTLIEPLLRRTRFLDEVVRDLDLVDVVVDRSRGEDATGLFDVVLSRAVAPLPRLVELCLPLARRGGSMVAMKGERADAEVAAVPLSSWATVGAAPPEVLSLGGDLVDPQVRVVRVVRETERRVRWADRAGGKSGGARP